MKPETWLKLKPVLIAMLGRAYQFGSKWSIAEPNPTGPIDCSGFVRWSMAQAGFHVPDGSEMQYEASRQTAEPMPGDVGFFKKPGEPCHHVGILCEDGNVIESRGAPYNAVILRPRTKWEAWPEFTGWRRFDVVDNGGAK